jgi:hypothetical protein
MSVALDLIETVRANGGKMRVEGDSLVIAPDSAALPIVEELRQYKREIIRLLESRPAVPAHDPEAWRAPFTEWLHSACTFHPRAFAGVRALHIAYCEWEIDRRGVPCSRETFETLLQELGFLMGEVERTLLVSGLIFRDDAAAYSLFAEQEESDSQLASLGTNSVIEETMTRKEIEAEFIALAQQQMERLHPGIVVRFVPSQEESKPIGTDRKCCCHALPGQIVFCHCLCGDDDPYGPADPGKIGGTNATEAA